MTPDSMPDTYFSTSLGDAFLIMPDRSAPCSAQGCVMVLEAVGLVSMLKGCLCGKRTDLHLELLNSALDCLLTLHTAVMHGLSNRM